MSNLEPTDQAILKVKYAKDLFMRGKSYKARELLNEALSLLPAKDSQAIDDELLRMIKEER